MQQNINCDLIEVHSCNNYAYTDTVGVGLYESL